MILSNDAKRLITTSDKGVIYVWKVPEHITMLVQNAKAMQD